MFNNSSLLEVSREVKIDHDNNDKVATANTLIREMIIHGDAEHVAFRFYTAHGLGDAAEHNKEEHAEVSRLVYEADSISPSKREFDQIISRAVTAFFTLTDEEEEEQLPKLRSDLSPEQNDKLARDFLKARNMAPSRARRGQKAGAAQGKLQDKLAEVGWMIVGRTLLVDPKYNHPEI
ncbi:hypothetical protein OBBRIDRAFT_811824 [Obba rivulosa]|uniref:Uncharacterized protein n=1 Tax=Obba rivulosa TaxID=1052685 RepID=A0A8E2B1F5_9APHY|nr:hypothetical protein OBBRIDRAFT_811824 [Obba rivulosa]